MVVLKKLYKNQLISSAFYKGLSGVTLFLSISILLNYLGSTSYGIWVLLFTVFQWFLFMDFGVSNVLKTKIPELLAHDNYLSINSHIKSSYFISGMIGISLLIGSLTMVAVFDLKSYLNIPFSSEFTTILFVLNIFFFCVNFVLGIHKSLNIGVNKTPLSEQSVLVTQLSFLSIIFLISFFFKTDSSETKIFLVSVTNGCVTCAINIGYTVFFFKKNPFTIFKTPLLKKKEIVSLMTLGNKFMLIQVFMIIIFYTDSYLLSHYFGPEETSNYDIVSKYYNFPFMVIISGMAPLWPLFAENYSTRNKKWLNETSKKFHLYFIGFVILIMALTFSFKSLLLFWLKTDYDIEMTFVLWFSVLTILRIYFTFYAYFFNGIGSLKSQLFLMFIAAVFKIPFTVYLIKLNFGVSSVVITTAFFVLIWCVVLHFLAQNKIKKIQPV